MVKPANTAAFAEKTGRSWEGWLEFLDAVGARELSHKEIARKIVETGEASGWWAQGITVAYEQHIGRRQPGQRSDGRHEVSVSRSVAGTLDEAMAAWATAAQGLGDADGVAFAGEPDVSASDKWRYWRRPRADGTRLSVTVGEKSGGKATITVTHEKLDGPEEIERWRGYWKAVLGTLAVK